MRTGYDNVQNRTAVKIISIAVAVCCTLSFAAPALSATHRVKHHSRHVQKAGAPARVPTAGPEGLGLTASSVLVLDQQEGRLLYQKNSEAVYPIASITKLMTAMVTLDYQTPLEEKLMVDEADVDAIKHTGSRLSVGTVLTRYELLHLALMSSENRAAAALSRSSPGGREAFIATMNHKAAELGMSNTHFVEGIGLSRQNVSTAADLAKMVQAAYAYPLIREFTTQAAHYVTLDSGHTLEYRNSNALVRAGQWQIGLSKTGYIAEAGRCLVMQAEIAAKPVVIVLLHAWDSKARAADALRIKKWVETRAALHMAQSM